MNNELKSKIVYLEDKGINVFSLLEWYFSERSINEGITDYFKNLWSNIKHARDNWGGVSKDLGQNDKNSINQISNLIVNLRKKYGDKIDDKISKILDDATKELNSVVYDPSFRTNVGRDSDIGSSTGYAKAELPKAVQAREKGRFVSSKPYGSTSIYPPARSSEPIHVSSFEHNLSFKEWLNELQ